MALVQNYDEWRWKLLLASALALATAVVAGAEPLQPVPHDMVGTMNCTAVSCHGGGGPRYWSGSPKGSEYVHWLGTTATYSDGRKPYDPRARLIKTDGDPHALAAQRMQEPRFQEVLRRASGRADGSVNEAMRAKCAKCHDPGWEVRNAECGARSGGPSLEEPTSFQIATVTGIGCETCHGGAKGWLSEHYREGVSRQELLRLGMVDTKDLQVRAKLCASCHVGSAENDMNHDMIAAGHPPLRFEQASYEALLGKKHWDDTPARMADGEYEVKLWAAGRVAAASAAVELLEARSEVRDQRSEVRSDKPWPELAEWNCLACHQPLRREGDQKVELGLLTSRGRTAAWQSWNTALVEAAFLPIRRPTSELPPPGGWTLAIGQLRAAMERSAVPDARQVSLLASEAKDSLMRQASSSNSRVTALSVLEGIGEIKAAASWDEMCQQLAALAAVRRALEDQGKMSSYQTDAVRQRMDRMAKTLRFTQTDREWPALYADRAALSPMEVAQELTRLKHDLMSEARR